MKDQHAAVEAVIRQAGNIAMEYFSRIATIAVEAKGPLDLVSEGDRAVEQFIASALAKLFPDDGVLGEEGSFREGRSGRTWVIDPIDGTFNFLRGSRDWGVSIGLFEGGRPAYGIINAPVRREVMAGGTALPAVLNGEALPPLRPLDARSAAVGVGIHPSVRRIDGARIFDSIINDLQMAFRVTGCSVVSLIDVARGAVDGYIGVGIPCWDILGMLPVLERLGAETTIDWKKEGLSSSLSFVCGAPELQPAARILARPKA